MQTHEPLTVYRIPDSVVSVPLDEVQGWSAEDLASLPTFNDPEQDYTKEWARALQGGEDNFPIEASFANHYFVWPHVIDGELRLEFDCTKVDSFQFIPPETYIAAYNAAKEREEI